MKKYFKARGLKENYDPQNKHKDIFYFAEDTGQLLLDGVSYSEATDLTPYAKAPNLPDYVISNVGIYEEGGAHIYIESTKDNLIDGSHDKIKVEIPIAENYKVGLMPTRMYSKIDHLPNRIVGDGGFGPVIRIQSSQEAVVLRYEEYFAMDESNTERVIFIDKATSTNAGVMSASDKYKLNSLVKYQAGNGIDITGDTISCTLDTSLYSIVTELPETGLPNKIYLLPSTKTEEGNIYTEYGYVDNKWEELGKYKAEIDLSNYVQYTDIVTDTTNGLMLASDKIKLDAFEEAEQYAKAINLPGTILKDISRFGKDLNRISLELKKTDLYSNSEITSYIDIYGATSSIAGVMSASDKVKLDGIETGAQVNKIESISVNGTPLEITNKGVNIPNATTEKDGMMSANDKTKLDSLDNYTLPAATTTTLGGVKVPTNLSLMGSITGNHLGIDSEGELGLAYSLSYRRDSKQLRLEYLNGTKGTYDVASTIDCTDFIKDGMLESANVEVNPEGYDAGTYIKLVFNTDAGKDPVYINVSDLIHEYTAGDGINIADGVISTTPISIKTEKFSFVNSGSHQPTYNYSGVTIYDDRYISGTKYGIAFDEADIEPRTTITSPDGVRTVCFALNKSVRGKIDSIDGKENRLNFKSTSYLTYSRSGSDTNIDIKDDIKTSIDSIPGKQDALTEAQLNNINNAITSISVNDVEQVNTNGAVDLMIPTVSKDVDGLVPAYQNNNGIIGLKILGVNSKINSTGETEYNFGWKKFTIKHGPEHVFIGNPTSVDPLDNVLEGEGVFIRPATSTYAGIMTHEDKAKLDSQPTIKASDATGVTDDDYVVIKKSEYQSILDRLSALEGS